MKMIINIILITFLSYHFTAAPKPIENDLEAYNYCMTHQNSFVCIVWPIAEGKDKEIKKILNKYGSIKYRKKIQLSYDQAYYLLKKAHPHIPDMKEHVKWYFPGHTLQKAARVFIVTFDDTETAVSCKHAIRNLFHLQYRSIHINDFHTETIELAQFFFS